MKLYMRNTEKGLIPLYDSDLHEKKKLKLNEYYEVEIKKARNIEFHKKYFALIKLAWLNLPEQYDELYPHLDNFRKAVQIMAGFYDTYYLLDGTQIIDSKSIAFDSMDELEFKEVYNRVLDVIIKNILPLNTEQEIEQEIFNFL
jgi:hypothetical protein